MTSNYPLGADASPAPVDTMNGFRARLTPDPDVAAAGRRGSPESRYLAGAGKPLSRQVAELEARLADAAARDRVAQGALAQAESADRDRKQNHRGGNLPWPLRWFLPVGTLAEAVTAYVAMEVLVSSRPLAYGLSVLTALAGTGMACVLANRRLNRLPVPGAARLLEAVFVAVLTALRYESMRVQGAGMLTAAGAAALAALISAIGLIGIEEIVAETRTFGIFAGTLRLSWLRWRHAAAAKHLAWIRARIRAAAGRLQQHFLDFLLKNENLPVAEAQQRAAALKAALSCGEA